MLYIRTFIGRKLNYINGILRRQIELDRPLKENPNVKLTYEYYIAPRNPIDFISKRFFLFPYYGKKKDIGKNTINHLTFQELGDLAYYLDKERTIATCHDIFYFLEKKNYKKPLFLKKYIIGGLKRCKYIIAISEFTKSELIQKLKIKQEKIIVIKNGLNHKMFYPIEKKEINKVEPILPGYKKILHVGYEMERKNFITLLKAFYIIRRLGHNIKLIRVGESRYSHLIKNLGLEKHIIYLRNISDNRLREIYNLCDLYVYPSLYEGWGAPGLEAAACGTPVICSDIPIFREIYQDYPIYFPPKDYKILAEHILNVINNDDKKREMGKKGLEIVKQYSWEKATKQYLKLIKNILI
ncbi:MAG: glycosyltransferase family 4 protein [Candidatus Helarchaeota archaeon]